MDPVANLFLISFIGPVLGFLGREAQGIEEPQDMVDMIGDAPFFPDHVSDTGTGPEVGGEPGLEGPFEESSGQLFFLSGCQARGTARTGNGHQAFFPFGAEGADPVLDGSNGDAEMSGGSGLRHLFFVDESDGLKPSGFECLGS